MYVDALNMYTHNVYTIHICVRIIYLVSSVITFKNKTASDQIIMAIMGNVARCDLCLRVLDIWLDVSSIRCFRCL